MGSDRVPLLFMASLLLGDIGPLAALEAASSNGLLHYDGITFTRYTASDGLTSDAVGRLLVDHRGTLWFGAGQDVHSFYWWE